MAISFFSYILKMSDSQSDSEKELHAMTVRRDKIRKQLIDVYQLRIRTILELRAPVFHSGLTKQHSEKIEKVQKKAFIIILGSEYVNYDTALEILMQERLDQRREQICLNFARKCVKSERHAHMFFVVWGSKRTYENIFLARTFHLIKSRTSISFHSIPHQSIATAKVRINAACLIIGTSGQ